ncbi:hypothetical protein SH139x_003038 [Planctomycetaceae bacterium SH139]
MSRLPAVRFPVLNLWRNPFGELTTQQRAELARCDLTAELAWLRNGQPGERRVVEFLAPCGHGKTTHLLALGKAFPRARYIYVPPRRFRFQMPAPQQLAPQQLAPLQLLVDEADRLPWRSRRQLMNRGDVLAIGVHRSLKAGFARRGVAVLTREVSNLSDPVSLCQIFQSRIDASRVDPHVSSLTITAADAKKLIQRYGDDIRAMEHYLYGRVQLLGGNTNGEMRLVD